jgi:hypothetical protein
MKWALAVASYFSNYSTPPRVQQHQISAVRSALDALGVELLI